MSTERRLHPRVVVRANAEIRRGRAETFEQAMLHELSAGGAGVFTTTPLDLQGEVRLRFRLAGQDEDIEASGLVVYGGRGPSLYREFPFRSGVHFLDLHGERFERVRVWVWGRLHPGPTS